MLENFWFYITRYEQFEYMYYLYCMEGVKAPPHL